MYKANFKLNHFFQEKMPCNLKLKTYESKYESYFHHLHFWMDILR